MSDLETAITECSENVETEKVLDDDSLDKALQQLKEVTIDQDANFTCWFSMKEDLSLDYLLMAIIQVK